MSKTGNFNTGNWNTGHFNTGDYNIGTRNSGSYNSGSYNTGDRNIGDLNIGDCNIGDCNIGGNNTGDCNTGDCNTGDYNTGNWNTGDHNTGDCNTGTRNSGSYNSGSYNTGDWNKSSFNTGCFNTIKPTISLFNKPSTWTYRDWLDSDACQLLRRMSASEWVASDDMSDEEKAQNPAHQITWGYLRVLDRTESAAKWWDSLTDEEKEIIMAIPNFDKEIFKEITGIDVDTTPPEREPTTTKGSEMTTYVTDEMEESA